MKFKIEAKQLFKFSEGAALGILGSWDDKFKGADICFLFWHIKIGMIQETPIVP